MLSKAPRNSTPPKKFLVFGPPQTPSLPPNKKKKESNDTIHRSQKRDLL